MAHWLETFFSHGDDERCTGSDALEATPDTETKSSAASEGSTPSEEALLFVHGPPRAGQTSLLLQFAFSLAASGRRVVVILPGVSTASTQEENQVVPISPCDKCGHPIKTGNDNMTWSRISIKYFSSNSELQRFLCTFHMASDPPSALLIDSFERFFPDPSSIGNVYQTLAFAFETVAYMTKASGVGIGVITGTTESFFLRDRRALQRWCRFVEITRNSEEPVMFRMQEEEFDDPSGLPSLTTGDPHVRYEFSPARGGSPGIFQFVDVHR